MKTRQLEILNILINNSSLDFNEVCSLYDISRRTLFYDIEEINENIKDMGEVLVHQNLLRLHCDSIESFTDLKNNVLEPYYASKERQNLILFSILNDECLLLDEFADEFSVSKTTIVSDIDGLRIRLNLNNIGLEYNKKYHLLGDEFEIRDYYLKLLPIHQMNFKEISDSILTFNRENNLYLSDYSMYSLTKIIEFVEKRASLGFYIDKSFSSRLLFDLSGITDLKDESELNYLNAYILSLSTVKEDQVVNLVDEYVVKLLDSIKYRLALDLNWQQSFIDSLQNHLVTSYYRIHYGFPAINPSLTELKLKHYYLFINVKQTVKSLTDYNPFNLMRDEEIGFLVAYFASYMRRSNYQNSGNIRAVLVCPQGRAVSHYLESKIKKLIPNLSVVGVFSVDQIGFINKHYDYIISTVEIPSLKNVIVVSPLLSEYDKEVLISIFGRDTKIEEELLEIIKKHTNVLNEKLLIEEIEDLLNYKKEKGRYKPMLKELITKSRIQERKSVSDWKEAICVASEPLLKERIINENYIEAMINAVEQYGPYIVLADEFALPHASNVEGVNEIGMSMLKLEEPVNMLGKPVRIFLVLSTVDNVSHLKALSSLTDIISNEELFDLIKKSSKDEIYNIIQKEGM